MSHPGPHQVVSFVRRSTRMRPNRRAALDRYGSRYLVDVPAADRSTSISADATVDWDAVFGRSAPRVVEVGPGNGESLVALALDRPEADIVGFEVFEPSVGATVAKLQSAGVANVRLVQADGAQGLDLLFGPRCLQQVVTYFPDPWHKTRHHKRRLVDAAFAALVADRLAPGGTWRLATDWEDYAFAMRDVLDACPGLVNLHPGWAPRPASRPVTKFEQRGVEAGRTIRDLEYGRPW
jgi:tRNA (guanine-N7-)-methyltransferase